MRLIILNEDDERRLNDLIVRTGRTQTEIASAALTFYEDAMDALDTCKVSRLSIQYGQIVGE